MTGSLFFHSWWKTLEQLRDVSLPVTPWTRSTQTATEREVFKRYTLSGVGGVLVYWTIAFNVTRMTRKIRA